MTGTGATADDIRALHPGLDRRGQADMARDAAFDVYLAFLAHNDVWAKAGLVFKGGTAVRKFRCDPQTYHRISYDLDFTLCNSDAKERLPQLMSSTVPYMGCRFELELGPHSRVRIAAPFLETPLGVGFDAAEGRVLQRPDRVELLHRPLHQRFGIDWSFKVPVMTVDETVAEKLTRWHHRPLIRDLYDLSSLRPLVADTAAVARMWIIKGHKAYHNPNRGPTTSPPAPADFDGIINVPPLRDLELADLQFDTPIADHEKRALATRLLSEFSEAYAFCVDEVDAELEEWATDTEGEHTAAVAAAAAAMSAAAEDTPPPQPKAALSRLRATPAAAAPTVDFAQLAAMAAVVCGQQLGPRRSCRRMLRAKPCPQHPNSPGSRQIKRPKRS